MFHIPSVTVQFNQVNPIKVGWILALCFYEQLVTSRKQITFLDAQGSIGCVEGHRLIGDKYSEKGRLRSRTIGFHCTVFTAG